jgi:hypothetical protein
VPSDVGILSREGLDELIAAKRNLAVLPTSEIMYAAGVDFAGDIAPEIQFVQAFSVAIVTGSREIEGSIWLIEFLTSTRASGAIRKSGMEPLTVQLAR